MRTLAVVGTAGGVGVTTLVALAFAGLREHPDGAPRLLGYASGGLVERVGGDEVAALDAGTALRDAGRRTPRQALELLRSDDGVAVAVAAPDTPLGRADAARYLEVAADAGDGVGERVAVVLSQVQGRHRGGPGDAATRWPTAVVLRVPFDPALARGGPVAFDPQALRARTRPVVVAWQQHAARVLGR